MSESTVKKMLSSVETFDTTLRDGTQAEGISVSIDDKLQIVRKLDSIGITYIEAGYPASNEKEREVFDKASNMDLKNSKLVAFSMTRRKGIKAEDDPALQILVDTDVDYVSIVGKAAAVHVEKTLRTSLEENLKMTEDTVKFLIERGKTVFYDAEHFFDGYKENPEYSMEVLRTAAKAGAKRLVLCDTNGGMMPHEVYQIVCEVVKMIEDEGLDCGVAMHAHDDCGCAVANTVEAVRAGACQVQGTINGYGERVGNSDLITVIANLEFNMGVTTIGRERCKKLTSTANYVAEVLNKSLPPTKPFVGSSAFAHKGGLHVSALSRMPSAYEHTNPADVGNVSHIVVSELSGKASIIAKAEEFGLDIENSSADIKKLLQTVKDLGSKGYTFEFADATLELMFREAMGEDMSIFRLESYRVISDKREDGKIMTEATIKIHVGNERFLATGEGNGPVNALDNALRAAITRFYPQVEQINLTDFKVRVVDESSGTDAVTRVVIQSSNGTDSWVTIGVDENVIEASWIALVDSLEYGLLVADGMEGVVEDAE